MDPRPEPSDAAQRVAERIGLHLPDGVIPVDTDGRTVTIWTESPWLLDDWLRADDRRFSRSVDECNAVLGTDESRPDPEHVARRPVAQALSGVPGSARGTGWAEHRGPQGAFSWG